MRLSILTVVALATLAVACSGGGPDAANPTEVELLDLSQMNLSLEDLFQPGFENPYPAVVARVNGEDITGEELLRKQVGIELQARQAIPNYVGVVVLSDRNGDPNAPLEAIIDDRLIDDAVERLGLAPEDVEEDALAAERELAEVIEDPIVGEPVREALRLQGLPEEGWGATDAYREHYQAFMGRLALRVQECGRFGLGTSIHSHCSNFLAKERENADIVYFVRWAE